MWHKFSKYVLSVALLVSAGYVQSAGMLDAGIGALNSGVSGLNTVSQVTNSLSSLTGTLKSVTNPDTALLALPELQQIDGDLGGVVDQVKSLSPSVQNNISGVVQQSLPSVNSLVDQAVGVEGAGTILRPTLDAITSKLTGLVL